MCNHIKIIIHVINTCIIHHIYYWLIHVSSLLLPSLPVVWRIRIMSISSSNDNCYNYEEIPNGLWDQRKVLLERRLKGKKGRTGKFNSPLGVLTEEPVRKIFNGNDDVFVKTITITPLKYGNKNFEKKPICVKEEGATVEACLNRAWERMTSAWGTYWNPAAAGM